MFMPNNVSKNIIETDSLEEIFNYLTPDTAIFFDLDNTLLEPCQHFGSVQWGEYYINKLLKDGEPPHRAEEIAQGLWSKYLPNAPLRLIEPKAPTIFSQLQAQGCMIFGLTARYPAESIYTHPQLEKLGFAFERKYNDRNLDLEFPAVFEKGVIFSSTLNKKSKSLISLLEQIDYRPKKIIFIDDKLSHVEDLEIALGQANIDYLGIRYAKADPRVNSFDWEIAEFQMQKFPHFISDEEAIELLLNLVHSKNRDKGR